MLDWLKTLASEAACCESRNVGGRGSGTSKFGGRDHHVQYDCAKVSGSGCREARGGLDSAATWHVNRVNPKQVWVGK
ncbi:hypothetical protein KIN20_025191 [Parelaphostrongylus tenuis]|uniref:Uncharacterized protein n=1 Tax=Parelaphostrongylus tenuis TaxID=148309 RepID=A0AAD5QWT4_PARTN|nr:hypothetical protein KIN20_025191 [Parelaphostrongylus tenuis]